MNTLKQKISLALLLAGSLAVAAADPVVFNVNMSVQTALGYFNAANGDTVRVLGLNGDWSTGVGMVPSTTNAAVYTVTNDLTAWSWPNYQFVIVPASGSWIWESPANFGGNARYVQIPAGGTNLPTVFFSDNSTMPSGSVSITFQVNMTSAIQLGIFTIGSDYVNAFGSFDNWGTTGVLLTNVPGTSNYVGTLVTSALASNTVVYYKYAIDGNGGTWEGNVGPSGAQNRAFTVTNTVQALPQDYWNNLANITTSYNVSFTADMTAMTALGLFAPGSDTVFVNGDWNWSGSAVQLQPTANPYVYTNTASLVFALGTTVNYKFTLDGGLVWEINGVGPGGANNHQFVLGGNTNLPANFFNNISNLGPLTISQSGPQTILTWFSATNANSSIRAQSSSSLTGGWVDVTNTQGQSSVTNNFGAGPMYFRLVGP